METAGDLVGVLVELAARVQLGHDHFEGADLLRRVDIHGDPAAVVLHRHRVPLGKEHGDGGARADKGLVDRVVDDLEDKLVQSVQACRADVHARPLADVLQTFENLYIVCAVSFWH